MDTALLTNRMLRAARLDSQLYEDVEHDVTALPQALVVVVLSSVATGLAFLVRAGFTFVRVNAFTSLAGWYIWAYLMYWIGPRLLPEPQTHADHGELLRTLGFAAAPGVIRVVGVVPALLHPVFIVASLWMLASTVVAVRQALDYTATWRAFAVCAIGWFIILLLGQLVAHMFGGMVATP